MSSDQSPNGGVFVFESVLVSDVRALSSPLLQETHPIVLRIRPAGMEMFKGLGTSGEELKIIQKLNMPRLTFTGTTFPPCWFPAITIRTMLEVNESVPNANEGIPLIKVLALLYAQEIYLLLTPLA